LQIWSMHHSPLTELGDYHLRFTDFILAGDLMALKRWLPTLLLALAAAFSVSVNAQQKSSEYRLGDGDIIHITVFQNPDLTLDARVSESGTIPYPLIGSVKIGGMTLATAGETIANALKAGNFIQQPQVNVQLVKNVGNQVSVLGQIVKPGRFPLETFGTRLSEMLAMAGGISTTGADIVVVTGTRDGKPFRKEIDVAGMFLEQKLEDDLVVAGGDVIYVPRHPMFYIYGEVQRPGSYLIERGMTVRQALVMGGGFTVRGAERNLGVFRRGADGKVERTPINLDELVRPDEVLHVRESLF
jgi:polysaccharide export outer membrane protein